MDILRPENDNEPYQRGERVRIGDPKTANALRSYFREDPPYVFLSYGKTKEMCFVTTLSVWNDLHQRKRIPPRIPTLVLEQANYDLPPIYGISSRALIPVQGPRG